MHLCNCSTPGFRQSGVLLFIVIIILILLACASSDIRIPCIVLGIGGGAGPAGSGAISPFGRRPAVGACQSGSTKGGAFWRVPIRQ